MWAPSRSPAFANLGFHMVGADVVESKVESIQSGVSPIVEEGLETLLRDGVSRGLIEATTDVEDCGRAAPTSPSCPSAPQPPKTAAAT